MSSSSAAATSVPRSACAWPTSATTCWPCAATPTWSRHRSSVARWTCPREAPDLSDATSRAGGRRAHRPAADRGVLPGDLRRRDGAGARCSRRRPRASGAGLLDRRPRQRRSAGVQDEDSPAAPSDGPGRMLVAAEEAFHERIPHGTRAPALRPLRRQQHPHARHRSARAGSTTRTAGPTGSTATTPRPRSSTC